MNADHSKPAKSSSVGMQFRGFPEQEEPVSEESDNKGSVEKEVVKKQVLEGRSGAPQGLCLRNSGILLWALQGMRSKGL